VNTNEKRRALCELHNEQGATSPPAQIVRISEQQQQPQQPEKYPKKNPKRTEKKEKKNIPTRHPL